MKHLRKTLRNSRHPDGIMPQPIRIIELLQLKHASRQYYVKVPLQLVDTFHLLTGDVLRVEFKEVFHQDLRADEEETKTEEF